ncbi:hypothetical protein CEXT_414411 [Caerostris extrusa]|uniref:Uncharacterized protein n=1 Tax=Caerostris extrusa TaxID=172846 RepID=A0AAV4NRS8_CAEEX|nr:hypothetical protein CEXT_414411 [Caerostris extrusa]
MAREGLFRLLKGPFNSAVGRLQKISAKCPFPDAFILEFWVFSNRTRESSIQSEEVDMSAIAKPSIRTILVMFQAVKAGLFTSSANCSAFNSEWITET